MSPADRDGVDDLLATSWAGNELAILHHGEAGIRITRIELDDNAWGVAGDDLNGDRRTDIVVANDGGPHVTCETDGWNRCTAGPIGSGRFGAASSARWPRC